VLNPAPVLVEHTPATLACDANRPQRCREPHPAQFACVAKCGPEPLDALGVRIRLPLTLVTGGPRVPPKEPAAGAAFASALWLGGCRVVGAGGAGGGRWSSVVLLDAIRPRRAPGADGPSVGVAVRSPGTSEGSRDAVVPVGAELQDSSVSDRAGLRESARGTDLGCRRRHRDGRLLA